MLRLIFTFLLLVHGLIHLMGFAKAFKFAEISQLVQPISKPVGAVWLAAALLFCLAAVLFFLKKDGWWTWALAAVVLSQILVFGNWQDAKFGTIANIIVLLAAIVGMGTARFYSSYEKEVKSNIKRTTSLPETFLAESDLVPLPAPVQKYLRYVGAVDKPKVHSFKVVFDGKIRKDEPSGWMPFTSEQYNFLDMPTRLFFMKATMKSLPVAGYHCFKNGEASMDIRLFSLAKVQYQKGREMDVSETVTFFNDMCCMAPATLIDARITWQETDGNKVNASFTNNGVTISAWLYFNEEGQLVNFISNDRYAAADDGTMRQTPWSTPLKDYKTTNGYKLAGYAETVYSYPSGDFVYGVFNAVNVEYNPQ